MTRSADSGSATSAPVVAASTSWPRKRALPSARATRASRVDVAQGLLARDADGQAAEVVVVERFQLEGGGPRAEERSVGSRGRHHQPPALGEATGQIAEDQRRGRVEPVGVLDQQEPGSGMGRRHELRSRSSIRCSGTPRGSMAADSSVGVHLDADGGRDQRGQGAGPPGQLDRGDLRVGVQAEERTERRRDRREGDDALADLADDGQVGAAGRQR